MFYLGQVGLAASQRRVRDESITAYLCCQVDDDRIFFVLYLLSWKLTTKLEEDSRNVALKGGGKCFWTQLSWLGCKNVLNKTFLVDFW